MSKCNGRSSKIFSLVHDLQSVLELASNMLLVNFTTEIKKKKVHISIRVEKKLP